MARKYKKLQSKEDEKEVCIILHQEIKIEEFDVFFEERRCRCKRSIYYLVSRNKDEEFDGIFSRRGRSCCSIMFVVAGKCELEKEKSFVEMFLNQRCCRGESFEF